MRTVIVLAILLIEFVLGCSSTSVACEELLKKYELVHLMGIICSSVAPCLALIALLVSMLFFRALRRWQREDMKALSDELQKLSETSNQAGVPVNLMAMRAPPEHASLSGEDSSAEKRLNASGTSEIIKRM